jgi:Peptidase S24-like
MEARSQPAAVPEAEATDDQTRILLQDYLVAFRSLCLRVTGNCMMPALRPGDLVEVVPPQDRPARLGDIVLFRHPDGLRLHRLVLGPPRQGSFRRLKADRAGHWDPPVPAASILGTVHAIQTTDGTWTAPRRLAAVLASVLRAVLRRNSLRDPSSDDYLHGTSTSSAK